MDIIVRFVVCVVFCVSIVNVVSAITYSVKLSTGSHVNEIDSKFMSFTVDPKHLFSNNVHNNAKESVCMAAALAPAYLRIAGPSTSRMTLYNSSLAFVDLKSKLDTNLEPPFYTHLKINRENHSDKLKYKYLETNEESADNDDQFGPEKRMHSKDGTNELFSLKKTFKNKRQSKALKKRREKPSNDEIPELSISDSQWSQFARWAKNTGFDLVFALNNEEKMASGLWDPNSSLNMLTLAERENIDPVYWQLGYECRNQSIDEYLNDLETLKAIVESFEGLRWKSVGGDVTKCLRDDSKSDFQDYVTLSEDMMHAVVLNGNSSAYEIQRMSDSDRLRLLKLLSNSSTPLWLIDTPDKQYSEFHRAADWITSLGYSAKNGFTVHFRELIEEELYEPTLSFYLAILYKHLVGSKVLNLDMNASEAVLFAHCTSLHKKPLPGAVTFYGTNMGDETARFAVKLSKREEGGEIMQFILGIDRNQITVNSRPIQNTDIRPVIKRVRPYKTLLFSLPPNSFGFWVIANTKIEACQRDYTEIFVEAVSVDDEIITPSSAKVKRSNTLNDDISQETLVKEGLRERARDINNNLRNVKKYLNVKETVETHLRRKKRQIDENDVIEYAKKKFRKSMKKFKNSDETKPKLEMIRYKNFDVPKPRLDFLRKLFGLPSRLESTRNFIHDRVRKDTTITEIKNLSKKKIKDTNPKSVLESENNTIVPIVHKQLSRERRSKGAEKSNMQSENFFSENDIGDTDFETEKQIELMKILHKIHQQIKDLSLEDEKLNKESNKRGENTESKDEDQIIVKTKMLDNGATINFKEKTKNGLLKSSVKSVVSVLSDLNNNLNNIWNALSLLG